MEMLDIGDMTVDVQPKVSSKASLLAIVLPSVLVIACVSAIAFLLLVFYRRRRRSSTPKYARYDYTYYVFLILTFILVPFDN